MAPLDFKKKRFESSSNESKGLFENINELIKSIIWPLIILFVFFEYKGYIDEVAALLPDKIKSSSKVSIGSFSVEIERKAKIKGYDDLGQIITGLSEEGIRKLLALSVGSYMIVSRDYQKGEFTYAKDLKVYAELKDKGLIIFNEPINEFENFFLSLNPSTKTMYRCNDKINGEHVTGEAMVGCEKIIHQTVLKDNLSQSQINRIENFGVKLSGSGRQAYDIIVQVTSEQVNAK